ncbi:MAG TPA: metallophosphoesterase, partial [Gemmatimonadaceae bacterium]|nr:metallophosphoesterase [Gemmatimonadaceae bacterium]
LRVAFASDFHAGPTTHPSLLRAACDALARARPDVLLLGGDFVSLHAVYVDPLVRALGAVPAPLGRFAVLGNHDLVADDAYITRRLASIGVEVLVNCNVRLPPPHDDVWVCGLDDPTRGDADGEATLAGADGCRLVLMHSPDGLLALAGLPFDLALCGHTHGGQVALPGGRAIVVPEGRLSRRFLHGLFHVETPPDAPDARLLVSRGVGCSGVPVRLFAPPEVHVCEVRGSAE